MDYAPEELEKVKAGLKRALDLATNEEVEALIGLGYTRSTLPVLYLVPLIYVAWADGEVSKKEADTIHSLAVERGVGKQAIAMLDRLLRYRPDENYLRRCLRILVRLYMALPVQDGTRAKRDLIDMSWEVARASGGFLGLGDKVSDDERVVLEQIAEGLKITRSARAESLQENLITRQLEAIDFQAWHKPEH